MSINVTGFEVDSVNAVDNDSWLYGVNMTGV